MAGGSGRPSDEATTGDPPMEQVRAGYCWDRPSQGRPVWEMAVQTKDSNNLKWYAFEFVVVCIGQYGDIPKIPEFPNNKGPEIFKGKILHTIDYCKLNKEAASQLLEGNKVVVVGYKKSAIDLAVDIAQANQGAEGKPCTMVRLGVSKLMESLLWKLPLKKYGLKPDHRFASCQIATVPENFFAEADKGNIVFKRASEWWFWEEGIEFDDNTKTKTDVVILGTGYNGMEKLKTILPEPFRSMIDYPYGIMALYRGIIHPLIPNMAFVGYVESVSNIRASELRSKWLARLMGEKFKLPSTEIMVEQTLRVMELMRRTTKFFKRPCAATFSINQADEMCEEMGCQL
ncbi:hypothetical protein V6N11_016446 [Hibiscus sabdariffa]|uniref:Flavin-containing monooxygenase n=1 Tax=Hibiscus sabdariffa TaxID=183260 RepID=A0ABR2TVA2_9ROSI